MAIDVYVHPGTEAWALKPADAERIARWVEKPIRIEYYPREMVEEVWSRDRHTNRGSMSREDLNFRGYSFATQERGYVAVIFVDHLEDYQSATFVVLHELAHLHMPPWGPRVEGTEEELEEEEDRADAVAARLMDDLLGYRPGVYEVVQLRSRNPMPRVCPHLWCGGA